MINKYKEVNSGYSNKKFRLEYDRRIDSDYLCGRV